MTADEILLFYDIRDPVYRGLVRWRMSMVREWYDTYLKGSVRDVLEIGTGNFPFSIALGDQLGQMSFVGIERDPGQKGRAELHLRDRFKSAVMHNCLWNEESARAIGHEAFDLVSSFEVYEHVPADQHFLQNMARVLRPGGYAIIETPNAQVTPLFTKVFGHSPDGAGDYKGNEHVNELSFRELFQDFRRSGFEVIDFNAYYLPVTLWQDGEFEPWRQTALYQKIHAAAGMFPFYAYVQAILGRKK